MPKRESPQEIDTPKGFLFLIAEIEGFVKAQCGFLCNSLSNIVYTFLVQKRLNFTLSVHITLYLYSYSLIIFCEYNTWFSDESPKK